MESQGHELLVESKFLCDVMLISQLLHSVLKGPVHVLHVIWHVLQPN